MWSFLLAAACTADPSDDAGDTDVEPVPTEARLGTGTEEFIPVEDGDEITIVFGPQGGYHLDGSMRASGVEAGDPDDLSNPDNPITAFRVWDETGDPISGLEGANEILYQEGLEPTDQPGVFEMVGRRIFLDIPSDDAIVGTMIDIEVEVHDVEDVIVSDRHTVLAIPFPFNP